MNINFFGMSGRLTRDVELRYASNGTPIAEIHLANNQKYKENEEVIFFKVVAFGKIAETISQYVSKGDPIYVQGTIRQNEWETKDGVKRSEIYGIVNSFQFLNNSKNKGTTNGQGKSVKR